MLLYWPWNIPPSLLSIVCVLCVRLSLPQVGIETVDDCCREVPTNSINNIIHNWDEDRLGVCMHSRQLLKHWEQKIREGIHRQIRLFQFHESKTQPFSFHFIRWIFPPPPSLLSFHPIIFYIMVNMEEWKNGHNRRTPASDPKSARVTFPYFHPDYPYPYRR